MALPMDDKDFPERRQPIWPAIRNQQSGMAPQEVQQGRSVNQVPNDAQEPVALPSDAPPALDPDTLMETRQEFFAELREYADLPAQAGMSLLEIAHAMRREAIRQYIAFADNGGQPHIAMPLVRWLDLVIERLQ
ncbi:hypothetical protein ANO11243_095480 [Dothideomycetidae sp. 11243]|nr:hypothetical protein ANO11243_095480 [fungal sp. No.11243]